MNRIFLISAIFVAAIFLIPTTPSTTMAYTCSSSSSTHNINSQTGVGNSSGGCSTSSSTSTSSGFKGSVRASTSAPNGCVHVHLASDGGGAVGGQCGLGDVHTGVGFSGGPGGVESTSSSSAGGSQASCSTSSGTAATGSSSSISASKPGTCP